MGRTARRSPQLRGDSNPSRPRSSSWAFTNRNGTGAARRPPSAVTNAGRPEPSCDMILFGGIKLWPIFVSRDLLLLFIGEKFGQRSRVSLLLRRHRGNVDEAQRLR
jgi:hypothetical protein